MMYIQALGKDNHIWSFKTCFLKKEVTEEREIISEKKQYSFSPHKNNKTRKGHVMSSESNGTNGSCRQTTTTSITVGMFNTHPETANSGKRIGGKVRSAQARRSAQRELKRA